LEEVEETQAEGTITTKNQALALAQTIAKRGRSNEDTTYRTK